MVSSPCKFLTWAYLFSETVQELHGFQPLWQMFFFSPNSKNQVWSSKIVCILLNFRGSESNLQRSWFAMPVYFSKKPLLFPEIQCVLCLCVLFGWITPSCITAGHKQTTGWRGGGENVWFLWGWMKQNRHDPGYTGGSGHFFTGKTPQNMSSNISNVMSPFSRVKPYFFLNCLWKRFCPSSHSWHSDPTALCNTAATSTWRRIFRHWQFKHAEMLQIPESDWMLGVQRSKVSSHRKHQEVSFVFTSTFSALWQQRLQFVYDNQLLTNRFCADRFRVWKDPPHPCKLSRNWGQLWVMLFCITASSLTCSSSCNRCPWHPPAAGHTFLLYKKTLFLTHFSCVAQIVTLKYFELCSHLLTEQLLLSPTPNRLARNHMGFFPWSLSAPAQV